MKVTITTSATIVEFDAPNGAEVIVEATTVRVRPLPAQIRITGLDDLQFGSAVPDRSGFTRDLCCG